MERETKKAKAIEGLKLRKNEARGLLRKCFGNDVFSLVPFEIWRNILCEGETDVIVRISQTCWGFKELVDNLRDLILENALKYRREDKIEIAKNLILRCADIGDDRAMFHIAYAYSFRGGWGLKEDFEKGVEWFKKSAKFGNGDAKAYYADCLFHGVGVEKNEELGNILAKKVLSSNNNLGIAYCHYAGRGTLEDRAKAYEHYKLSAEEGDEFGQRWLGICLEFGEGVDVDNDGCFEWYLKSAEQGFAPSQHDVAYLYWDGKGCEENEDVAKMWLQKASNQGYN